MFNKHVFSDLQITFLEQFYGVLKIKLSPLVEIRHSDCGERNREFLAHTVNEQNMGLAIVCFVGIFIEEEQSYVQIANHEKVMGFALNLKYERFCQVTFLKIMILNTLVHR